MLIFCAAFGYVYYAMVHIIVPAEVSAEEEKGSIIKGTLHLMIEKYFLLRRHFGMWVGIIIVMLRG